MEIIKEIGHINCSNSSLTNFFSDINNYKEVFSNEVSSFEILNENVFEIKIGSFPKISLTPVSYTHLTLPTILLV